MKKLIMSALFALLLTSIAAQRASAALNVPSHLSKEIWKSVDIIGKIEELPIIKKTNQEDFFSIDSLACVFENYNACSFFTEIEGQRKMLVIMDGSARFMQSLVDAGIALDEEYARLDVESINCKKIDSQYSCTLVEFSR